MLLRRRGCCSSSAASSSARRRAGRRRTPDELPSATRRSRKLKARCDRVAKRPSEPQAHRCRRAAAALSLAHSDAGSFRRPVRPREPRRRFLSALVRGGRGRLALATEEDRAPRGGVGREAEPGAPPRARGGEASRRARFADANAHARRWEAEVGKKAGPRAHAGGMERCLAEERRERRRAERRTPTRARRASASSASSSAAPRRWTRSRRSSSRRTRPPRRRARRARSATRYSATARRCSRRRSPSSTRRRRTRFSCSSSSSVARG